MQYEVEQKFAVDDLAEVEGRLIRLGGEFLPPIEQSDAYYAHPSRDFAQTDEALWIRRTGDAVRITYKGPRIDATTKTRREIEVPLGGGAEERDSSTRCSNVSAFAWWRRSRSGDVRCICLGCRQEVEVVLDDVHDVGAYVELELSADEAGLDQARRTIASLAAELQLSANERRSYLELSLAGGSK